MVSLGSQSSSSPSSEAVERETVAEVEPVEFLDADPKVGKIPPEPSKVGKIPPEPSKVGNTPPEPSKEGKGGKVGRLDSVSQSSSSSSEEAETEERAEAAKERAEETPLDLEAPLVGWPLTAASEVKDPEGEPVSGGNDILLNAGGTETGSSVGLAESVSSSHSSSSAEEAEEEPETEPEDAFDELEPPNKSPRKPNGAAVTEAEAEEAEADFEAEAEAELEPLEPLEPLGATANNWFKSPPVWEEEDTLEELEAGLEELEEAELSTFKKSNKDPESVVAGALDELCVVPWAANTLKAGAFVEDELELELERELELELELELDVELELELSSPKRSRTPAASDVAAATGAAAAAAVVDEVAARAAAGAAAGAAASEPPNKSLKNPLFLGASCAFTAADANNTVWKIVVIFILFHYCSITLSSMYLTKGRIPPNRCMWDRSHI